MKWLLVILLLGCTTSRLIHGVYGITDVDITQQNDEYYVQYYIHVGKDIDYYTIDYYVSDELLYSSRKETKRNVARNTVGYLEGIIVSEPTEIKLVVRSVIGDMYAVTRTKEYKIIVE